jgi:hypothetical protein
VLNKTTLEVALLELFQGKPLDAQGNYTWPKDVTDAGKKWAKIYTNYAKDATPDPPGEGKPTQVALDAAELKLAVLLTKAFSESNASLVSTGISSALSTFWIGMLFTDSSTITDSATGAVVLATALESTWVKNMKIPPPGVTTKKSADQHATLFDTYTKTIITATPPSIVGKLV